MNQFTIPYFGEYGYVANTSWLQQNRKWMLIAVVIVFFIFGILALVYFIRRQSDQDTSSKVASPQVAVYGDIHPSQAHLFQFVPHKKGYVRKEDLHKL